LVRLPARAAGEAVKPLSPRKAAALRLGNTGPLSGVTLVVVDDEEDARELVAEAFSRAGATVHLAASAAEALTLILRVRPAALVSDIGMPHEDGYALMRQLRSRAAAQGGSVPAIAVTAYASQKDRAAAEAAGYQAHIAKPFEPSEVATLVAHLAGIAHHES
jgi:CheY-like chemotaxis protein